MSEIRLALAAALTAGVLILPVPAAAHPLDPLTPDEIRAAAQIARTDARFSSALFASILLNEPAKADVAQNGVEALLQIAGQLIQGCEPSQACHDSGSTHALKRRLSRFLNG